ncbi:unnamed protein product [Arctia plantaginis]|uniref:Uncharacterized protein n=1 Tax=Arctia plantaginis TaxID=874455 RepID=A0A8S1AV46_ARCPL|nr:unnamed protein product [Arctia plantaginis]
MSKLNAETIISELPKKIATLTLKITIQSALIEAQNKKIDNQQQTINHLTKVIEDLTTKIDKLLTSTSVSEIQEPTKMAATQGVSETLAVAAANVPAPNVTSRARRAMERNKSKGVHTHSSNTDENVTLSKQQLVGKPEKKLHGLGWE